MKKSFKGLLVTFLVGLLLIGIGSGICFAEVTSIKYMGSKVLDIGALETKTKEVYLDTDFDRIRVNTYSDVTFVVDETLPNDKIVVQTDINADTELYINTNKAYYDKKNDTYYNSYDSFNYEVENNGISREDVVSMMEVSVNITDHGYNGFNYFRVVLNDLKKNEFYQYDYEVSDVIVRLSPENQQKLIRDGGFPN